jgi:hypothetical protein
VVLKKRDIQPVALESLSKAYIDLKWIIGMAAIDGEGDVESQWSDGSVVAQAQPRTISEVE